MKQISTYVVNSRFYTETNITTRRSLVSNFSSVSIKFLGEVKTIEDVEFHFLLSN